MALCVDPKAEGEAVVIVSDILLSNRLGLCLFCSFFCSALSYCDVSVTRFCIACDTKQTNKAYKKPTRIRTLDT